MAAVNRLVRVLASVVPVRLRDWSWRRSIRPTMGRVDFGDLRRSVPISESYGFERGLPIDRYFIERFLGEHGRGDIKGHVLEIEDSLYTRTIGGYGGETGPSPIERVDVLDIDPGNPRATITADLASARDVPSNTFDCIICTQTLQYIYEIESAVHTLCRLLKPGGVALVTVPGITRSGAAGSAPAQWHLTSSSAARLFTDAFGPEAVTIETYGNVLAATAFLHGLATDELTKEELDRRDPAYEVVIGIRAGKDPSTA
jgi:SAM-dependent methyltransferase